MRWFETAPAERLRRATKPSSSAQHRIKEFLLHETPLRARGAPCRLTCAFAPCSEREFPLRRFSHVMAWCQVAVLRAGRSARAGLARFRRAGGLGGLRADVPKPAADPGRGQPARRGGPFP